MLISSVFTEMKMKENIPPETAHYFTFVVFVLFKTGYAVTGVVFFSSLVTGKWAQIGPVVREAVRMVPCGLTGVALCSEWCCHLVIVGLHVRAEDCPHLTDEEIKLGNWLLEGQMEFAEEAETQTSFPRATLLR